MNRQEHHETLKTLLQQEQVSTSTLLTCLQQERHALATMDSSQLESLAREKHSLLQALEHHACHRGELALTAGYGTSPEQMQVYIAWADQSGELEQCWGQLLEQLQQCQHQNRVNGGAIELGRQQLRTILGVLRGQDKSRDSTYQANGQTPSNLGNRSLGCA